MRWYYLSNFTRYKIALDKVVLISVDSHDAIAADQARQKGTCPNLLNLITLHMLTENRCPRRLESHPTRT